MCCLAVSGLQAEYFGLQLSVKLPTGLVTMLQNTVVRVHLQCTHCTDCRAAVLVLVCFDKEVQDKRIVLI